MSALEGTQSSTGVTKNVVFWIWPWRDWCCTDMVLCQATPLDTRGKHKAQFCDWAHEPWPTWELHCILKFKYVNKSLQLEQAAHVLNTKSMFKCSDALQNWTSNASGQQYKIKLWVRKMLANKYLANMRKVATWTFFKRGKHKLCPKVSGGWMYLLAGSLVSAEQNILTFMNWSSRHETNFNVLVFRRQNV